MSIGEKDQRIVIETPTPAVDAEGQPVEAWTTHATIWAEATFLSGRELEAMQKINEEIVLRFITAVRRDLNVKMRVRWKSPVSAEVESWNINAIQPVPDNKHDMALLVSKVE